MKDSSVNDTEAEQKRFSFDRNPVDAHRFEPVMRPVAGEEPVESDAVIDSGNDDDIVEVTDEAPAVVTNNEESRALPGHVLAAERTRRGFSVSEVAGQLFLTEAQIAALEADQYDHFPAAIFVTGYIRNYARLLDLPPDPLVELFNAQGAQPPPALNRVSRTGSTVKAKQPPLDPRIIGGAVALVVVILLAWWGFSSDDDATVAVDEVATLDSASTTPLTSTPIIVTQQAPVVAAKPVVVTPPPVVKKASPQVSQPAPVIEVPAAVVRDDTVAASDTSADAASEVAPQPEFIPDRAAAEGFPDTLELTFSAESWTEITDATGRRVMFGLGKPGQTRALSGTAPFKILFGYSPAVSMVYNGEPFDQRKFSRREVARFTLGERSE